jgi:antitoxin HicB
MMQRGVRAVAEGKGLDYYLSLPYSVRLTRRSEDGDTFYVAEIPDLPGCMSDGKTEQEALNMVEEAKRLWLEAALKDGLDIPEPRDYLDFSGKFVLRLPRALHRNLALQANELGVSLNQYVVHLLSEATAVQKATRELQDAFARESWSLRAKWTALAARLVSEIRNVYTRLEMLETRRGFGIAVQPEAMAANTILFNITSQTQGRVLVPANSMGGETEWLEDWFEAFKGFPWTQALVEAKQ